MRIAVDLPARFRSQAVSVDGRAGNLSQSGILFVGRALEHRPPTVRLQIDLPDSEGPIEVGGEIAWAGSRGLIGIRFTEIAIAMRRRLANFVIRRAFDLAPLPR
jgi:hypothetical protein